MSDVGWRLRRRPEKQRTGGIGANVIGSVDAAANYKENEERQENVFKSILNKTTNFTLYEQGE